MLIESVGMMTASASPVMAPPDSGAVVVRIEGAAKGHILYENLATGFKKSVSARELQVGIGYVLVDYASEDPTATAGDPVRFSCSGKHDATRVSIITAPASYNTFQTGAKFTGSGSGEVTFSGFDYQE